MMKIGKYLLVFLLCFGIVGCSDNDKEDEVKKKVTTYEDVRQLLYDNDVLWGLGKFTGSEMIVDFRFKVEESTNTLNYAYFSVALYEDGEIQFITYHHKPNKIDGNIYLSEAEVERLKEKYTDPKLYEVNQEALKSAEDFLERFSVTIENIELAAKTEFLNKTKDKESQKETEN